MKPTFLLLLSLSAPFAAAALPPAAQIQGLYQGDWRIGDKRHQVEGRLVAMGQDRFKLLLRRTAGGEVIRAELDGRIEGESVRFQPGSKSSLTLSEGALRGSLGGDTLFLERVIRSSPSLGKQPPEGAVVLLDGKSFDNMKANNGEWGPVNPEDGSVEVPKGGMNSVPNFGGSFDAHVEFQCNFRPEARSQGRGNSGCYLPNGQEIQVLDSFGMTTYLGGGCGGLYGKKNPDTMEPIPSLAGGKENVFNLASAPPLQWQTYDIEYRVKPDESGKETGYLTVHHNGIRIHDAVELNHKPGGFHFQDHGNPVRYRNIWVVEK